MRVTSVQLGGSLAGKLSSKLSSILSSEGIGASVLGGRARLRRFATGSLTLRVIAGCVM
jgi:hypothetical protein